MSTKQLHWLTSTTPIELLEQANAMQSRINASILIKVLHVIYGQANTWVHLGLTVNKDSFLGLCRRDLHLARTLLLGALLASLAWQTSGRLLLLQAAHFAQLLVKVAWWGWVWVQPLCLKGCSQPGS